MPNGAERNVSPESPSPPFRATISIALIAVAAALGAWAFTDIRFRDPEGFLAGRAVFPLAAAAATLIILVGYVTRWLRSAAWLALALIAQAASQQLVEAGPRIRYQHFPPVERLLDGFGWLFAAILGAQAAMVAFGIGKALRRRGLAPDPSFPSWKLGLTILAVSAVSATFSRRPEDYASELALASLVQLAALGNIALTVLSLPDRVLGKIGSTFERLLGGNSNRVDPEPGGVDRFAIVIALSVTAAALLLSIVVYERHPHIPDEVAYLMHAGYFAEGKAFMPSPPAPAAFDVDLMMMTRDKWFSPFPPGWPAALALGTLLGVPWAVNATLAGLCALLSYVFLRELYSRRTARLTLLLLSVSPWFVFMGMSFMSHMLALAAALAAAIAIMRVVRTGDLAWAWAGGAAVGALSLVRPLDGLVIAILLGAYLSMARGKASRAVAIPSFIVSCGGVAALALPYNKALTGSATTFPLDTYFGALYPPGANDLGFGDNRGFGWTGIDPLPGHGLLDVIINSGMNAFSVNVELLGWATGSVMLMVAFLIRGKLHRSDRMMLAVILSVAGIYSLYWFSGGPDFGARYWFLILIPCLALTARAVESLPKAADATEAAWRSQRSTRLLAGMAALSVMAIVTFFPWRAIDKYHHYRVMRPGIQTLAHEHGFGRSLVLVRGERHPDFASAVVYNAVGLRGGGPIYAWARSPDVAAAARAAFPSRSVWWVNGPSMTGRGFEVAIPADSSVKRP